MSLVIVSSGWNHSDRNEEYGTVPSASGVIERAVRRSCNHVVGSECIPIWLTPTRAQHGNSTCPICRHALFEIEQPHMRIRSGAQRAHADPLQPRRIYPYLSSFVSISTLVSLTWPAAHNAHSIHDQDPMGDHSTVAIAAASVYMASYATGDPRSRSSNLSRDYCSRRYWGS